MRASTWIIGLLTAVFMIAGVTVFYASLNVEYGMTGYDSEDYEAMDKMSELTDQVNNIQSNVSQTKQQSGVLDVVGGYISSAFQSLKLIFTSVDTFNSMTETTAQANSGLGQGVSMLKGYIVLVVAVLIFIGLILSAIVKWRL